MSIRRTQFSFFLVAILAAVSVNSGEPSWVTLETTGVPTARHEAALVGHGGKLFLLGGRRINPVDVFDPVTKAWTEKSSTPLELHHFQGVTVDDRIFLMGAMTGKFPRETPLEKIVTYIPKDDRFEFVHGIPESRRRGGAGAVLHDGKIYLVGGITNGHMDGCQNWFDSYDPQNGDWEILPDAPHARDHFQAVVIGGRLYAAGGRKTSHATKELFSLTIDVIDVYDFASGKWLPEAECPTIPTPRAGNSCVVVDGKLVIGGGESGGNKTAHADAEVFDPKASTWTTWPSLQRGRHGSGLVVIDDYLYTASGSGNRGGSPELESTERLQISAVKNADETGFVDMFASGDFSDWRVGKKGTGWSLNDGEVSLDDVGAGWLISKKKYRNFELRFQWKISEGGNSGVVYRAQKGRGLEYQVLDDTGHVRGKKSITAAASVYDLVPAKTMKHCNPANEWNDAKIIAHGNHIEHWLNGLKVSETNIGSEQWDQQFAASKYVKYDINGFGTTANSISFQDHGHRVWYRNVRVKELETP